MKRVVLFEGEEGGTKRSKIFMHAFPTSRGMDTTSGPFGSIGKVGTPIGASHSSPEAVYRVLAILFNCFDGSLCLICYSFKVELPLNP
jgi:hypothetical protein